MVSNTDRIGAAACPWREDFDPFNASYLADPYPVFAEVRRAGPVHYAPSIDMYLVTRYDDIEAIFRDPLTYSAATAQDPITPLAGRAAEIFHRDVDVEPTQSNCDPPKHNRIRSHTGRAFSPPRMRLLEPVIPARAQVLFYALAKTGKSLLVLEWAAAIASGRAVLGRPASDFEGELAHYLADGAFHLPAASLSRVASNEPHNRFIGGVDLFCGQSCLGSLPRDQISLRNLQFLVLAVAGQPKHFEAVQEWAGQRIEGIRRGDEEHF